MEKIQEIRELIEQTLFDIESSRNLVEKQLLELKEILSPPMYKQEEMRVRGELKTILK